LRLVVERFVLVATFVAAVAVVGIVGPRLTPASGGLTAVSRREELLLAT
jgi:hypothetical protein